MIPKLVIATLGNKTNVFLEGKQIGKGVKGLVYSARDKEGNLRTLEKRERCCPESNQNNSTPD